MPGRMTCSPFLSLWPRTEPVLTRRGASCRTGSRSALDAQATPSWAYLLGLIFLAGARDTEQGRGVGLSAQSLGGPHLWVGRRPLRALPSPQPPSQVAGC